MAQSPVIASVPMAQAPGVRSLKNVHAQERSQSLWPLGVKGTESGHTQAPKRPFTPVDGDSKLTFQQLGVFVFVVIVEKIHMA